MPDPHERQFWTAGPRYLKKTPLPSLVGQAAGLPEFFELISKVQSNRADDQRGLLRKEDLVLPDFLHLPSCQAGVSTSAPREAKGSCPRTPHPDNQEKRREDSGCPQHPSDPADGQRSPEKTLVMPVALSQATSDGATTGTAPRPPTLLLQGSPRWKEEVKMVEEENVVLADLTLVTEGDIGSPNSRPIPSKNLSPIEAKAPSEKFKPGALRRPRSHMQGSDGSYYVPSSPNPRCDFNPAGVGKETGKPELPISCVIDVDSVTASRSLQWPCSEPESDAPRAGQPTRQARTERTSRFPTATAAGSEKNKENENPSKATFV